MVDGSLLKTLVLWAFGNLFAFLLGPPPCLLPPHSTFGSCALAAALHAVVLRLPVISLAVKVTC